MASSLRWDTALYAVATLIDRLLGFLLLPLLGRAISPADYGAWSQTAVTASMLMPVVLFGFSTTVIRYFSGRVNALDRRRYFWNLAGLALLLYTACSFVLMTFAVPLSEAIFGEPGRSAIMPILLLLLAADAATDYAAAWLRASGRIALVAIFSAARSVVRYAVVLLLVGSDAAALEVWLGQYAMFQMALALVVFASAAVVVNRSGDATSTNQGPDLFSLLRYSAPLVLLAALVWLNGFLDRFLLVHLLNLEAVAVYAAATSLCAIPSAFYAVLGFTLFPNLSAQWQERNLIEVARLTTLVLRIFLFLCVPVALFLALVGSRVLPLLTTVAYTAEPAVFLLLGISITAFGIYQIVLYALLLDGRSHQVLWLAASAAAINLALNLWLVRRFGITGAAASAAASNVVMVALAGRLTHTVLPWAFPWRELARVLGSAGVGAMPLILLVLFISPSSPFQASTAAVAAGLSLAIYIAIDWMRSESVMRSILKP